LVLRVVLEYKGFKGAFEGDYEDVWRFTNEFLGKLRHALGEVPVREIYPIDYSLLEGIIEYGPQGPELITNEKISQNNGILLALYSLGGKDKTEKILNTVIGWGIRFKNKKVFYARVHDLKKAGLIGIENDSLVLKLKGKKAVEDLLKKLKGAR